MSDEGRHLTSGEIAMLMPVYGNTINYQEVIINNHKWVYLQPNGRAMSPNGNVYYAPDDWRYTDDFANPSVDMSNPELAGWSPLNAILYMQHTFVHEMGHVFQDHDGQPVKWYGFWNGVEDLLGGDPYDYTTYLATDIPFDRWAIEAQAQFMADLWLQSELEALGEDQNPLIPSLEVLTAIAHIRLAPLPTECFLASTLITLSDGSTKPIEDIRVGDQVMSYNPTAPLDAPLTAKTVTELFRNDVTHILDVHGLMVTPGHVTLCGDGPHSGRHVPMIDILCSDGALVQEDGTLIRVATNAKVGSTEDAFVKLAYALSGEDARNGNLQAGEMRVGTLLFDRDDVPVSVLDCIRAEGLDFDPTTGLVQRGDGVPAPLNFFGPPPKSEDYILKRSEAKLADIIADGEWEGARPSISRQVQTEIH